MSDQQQSQSQAVFYKLIENIANLSVSLNEIQTRVSNLQQETARLIKQVNDIDRLAGTRLQAIEEELKKPAKQDESSNDTKL